MRERHSLGVLVPAPADRRLVHDVIYRELCLGVVEDSSREEYRRVIGDLVERGAEGVVLGCTEIDLLIGVGDSPVPLLDSTALHARAVVDLALSGT
jgi:aspartate racemase